MSKLLVMPKSTNIDKYSEYADGFIYGLNGYSVNLPIEVSIDEIKELSKKCDTLNKELFIAINKNIFTKEIDKLKEYLLELDKLNIKGILYADVALVNLKRNGHFKTDLVWSQEHLTTNYQTINNWYSFGVKYTYLSSDITLREIKEIKENTDSILIAPMFGYIPIFTSKRHEVKNYLDHFNLSDSSSINYIEKEEKVYPIVDNIEGTIVYSNNILNGYKEYLDLDIDYVTLNEFNIEDSMFIQVLKTFKEKKELDLEIPGSDKGFLFNETTYKVK